MNSDQLEGPYSIPARSSPVIGQTPHDSLYFRKYNLYILENIIYNLELTVKTLSRAEVISDP